MVWGFGPLFPQRPGQSTRRSARLVQKAPGQIRLTFVALRCVDHPDILSPHLSQRLRAAGRFFFRHQRAEPETLASKTLLLPLSCRSETPPAAAPEPAFWPPGEVESTGSPWPPPCRGCAACAQSSCSPPAREAERRLYRVRRSAFGPRTPRKICLGCPDGGTLSGCPGHCSPPAGSPP